NTRRFGRRCRLRFRLWRITDYTPASLHVLRTDEQGLRRINRDLRTIRRDRRCFEIRNLETDPLGECRCKNVDLTFNRLRETTFTHWSGHAVTHLAHHTFG